MNEDILVKKITIVGRDAAEAKQSFDILSKAGYEVELHQQVNSDILKKQQY